MKSFHIIGCVFLIVAFLWIIGFIQFRNVPVSKDMPGEAAVQKTANYTATNQEIKLETDTSKIK